MPSASASACLRNCGSALLRVVKLITPRMAVTATPTMTINTTSSIRVTPRWRRKEHNSEVDITSLPFNLDAARTAVALDGHGQAGGKSGRGGENISLRIRLAQRIEIKSCCIGRYGGHADAGRFSFTQPVALLIAGGQGFLAATIAACWRHYPVGSGTSSIETQGHADAIETHEHGLVLRHGQFLSIAHYAHGLIGEAARVIRFALEKTCTGKCS